MQQTCYTVLTGIMQVYKNGGVNDKIAANCATALAYLSAYSADPKQMEALFKAFDESHEGDDALIIPIKWGILTNGNDKIDKSAMS